MKAVRNIAINNFTIVIDIYILFNSENLPRFLIFYRSVYTELNIYIVSFVSPAQRVKYQFSSNYSYSIRRYI